MSSPQPRLETRMTFRKLVEGIWVSIVVGRLSTNNFEILRSLGSDTHIFDFIFVGLIEERRNF